jgi:putative photosynthetic complex assembly protein 2
VHSPWIAALTALFLWWFATGAILLVVRLCERRSGGTGRRAVLLALPVLGLGLWGYHATLDMTGIGAAYGAFLAALAIWGWIELSFLTGVITGPNQRPCPPGLVEWERFIRAWGTVAYHEMLLTAMLIVVWLMGFEAANTVGLWTFTVLYFARVTAKLNLYFGVPRINVEFIPRALAHMGSYFRMAPVGWFFPCSVTALSLAVACWLERLYSAGSPVETVGFALLGAITALALLEHWLMVLPLPDAKLWRWMLPAPKHSPKKTPPEGHHEF